MEENPSATEFMEAMLDVKGLDDPATVKDLHAKLAAMKGVQVLSAEGDKVIVRYDPAQSSLADIRKAFGGSVGEDGEKATRASPAGGVEETGQPAAS